VTSPPCEKTQENVKRKKNHENNPCTLPTVNIYRKKKLNSIIRGRVIVFGLRVGSTCLCTDINGGRHVTLSSRVQREDRIRGVPVGLSLGGATSRLENPVSLFVIFIEEVA
jgi:hypothetical protein